MSVLKSLAIQILILNLISAPMVLAGQNPPLPPTVNVPPSQIPQSINVNPQTLRHQLLETNLSLVSALDDVKISKEQVNLQRDNLFPSINLSTLLKGGPLSFVMNSVGFLLPFLSPTNWFNYKAQKNSFEAEKLSYYIAELNLYASALSLYLTINNNVQIEKTYDSEAADLEKFASFYENAAKIGAIPSQVLYQVRAQAELAKSTAEHAAAIVAQDRESLRQLLGLPFKTEVVLEDAQILPSDYEKKDIQTVIDLANKVAPEVAQFQYLANQADAQKWGSTLSFIGTSTLAATSPGGGSADFSNLGLQSNANLGFGIFPTFKIGKLNADKVRLGFINIAQVNQQLVASAMQSLGYFQNQFESASKSENDYYETFYNDERAYSIGAVTLTQVIFDRSQTAAATVSRLQAQLNLDLQRVVLQRALLTDEFSKIKGCGLKSMPKQKGSLDQLCRQTN